MHLTVIPSDKSIYLETSDKTWPQRRCHTIDDSNFWSSIDPNIHAIQYHTDGAKHKELKNPKEIVTISNESEVQIFIDKFNSAETVYQSQIVWDNDNVADETIEEKITRLGPRP